MTDQPGYIQTDYSYVDNQFGLNWNRLNKIITDGNVFPFKDMDGMQALATLYPIDAVCEYYGIVEDQKNNMTSYVGKSIELSDNVVKIVEDYFRSIGMPIPGGFRRYQKERIETKGFTEEKDVLKIVEETGKSVEQIAEENKVLDTNQTDDGPINIGGEEAGGPEESVNPEPKEKPVTKVRRGRTWKGSGVTKKTAPRVNKPSVKGD